ncbi:MAG: hypothetical protein U0136_00955 [Bdellovibrionota bacterium]
MTDSMKDPSEAAEPPVPSESLGGVDEGSQGPAPSGEPSVSPVGAPNASEPAQDPSAERSEAAIRGRFFEALQKRGQDLIACDKRELAEQLTVTANFLRNGLPRRPGAESIEHLLDNIQKAQSLTHGVQNSFELLDFELLGQIRLMIESYRLQKREREWGTFSAIGLIVEQEMRRNAGLSDRHEVAKLVCGLLVSTQLSAMLECFPADHKPAAAEILLALIEAADASGADGLSPAFQALLQNVTASSS